MITVRTTFTISISEDHITLEALSDQIGAAVQQAGRELRFQDWM
ncbi:MAG: hypothetical protein WBR18_15795 [Anaerolineales bacterium]